MKTWESLKVSEQLEFLLFIVGLLMILTMCLLILLEIEKRKKLKYYRIKYMFNNAPSKAVYRAYSINEASEMFNTDQAEYTVHKILKGTDTIDNFYKDFIREGKYGL